MHLDETIIFKEVPVCFCPLDQYSNQTLGMPTTPKGRGVERNRHCVGKREKIDMTSQVSKAASLLDKGQEEALK